MGDPKKPKKKYSRPSHPWIKSRIDTEKVLMKEYGLKNKKQLWRMEKILSNFKDQVKRLTASSGEQAEKEKQQLRSRLEKLDLLKKDQELGDVLALDLKSVLDRRLQSRIFKKELARSIDQARQFIVHEHIKVGDKSINSPSYLVSVKEDSQISFVDKSALKNPDHPERSIVTEAQDLKRKTEELKKEVEVKPAEDTPVEGKEQKDVTEEAGKEIEPEADEKVQKEALMEEAVHVAEEGEKEEAAEDVKEEVEEEKKEEPKEEVKEESPVEEVEEEKKEETVEEEVEKPDEEPKLETPVEEKKEENNG